MGRRRVVRPVPIEEKPRNDKRDEKKRQERVRKRAEELHEQGMPFQMAMAVAHGRLDLNEALERMARNDRIVRLMKKHDLSRALATQIALGQADLERVLYRRRFDEHRKEHRTRSVLDEAQESGESIVLGLHGGEEIEVEIAGSDTYGVQVVPSGGGDPREIHKLQIKFAYVPGAAQRVQKVRTVDPEVAADPHEPIERPQDRYACSDKRLFRYVDKRTPVRTTLLEGQQFSGRVAWFSRYEFQMAKDGDPAVTIFRHALRDLTEI